MSWFTSRSGKVLVVTGGVAGLVAVSMVASVAASVRAAAPQKEFVSACPEVSGSNETIGDLNIRTGKCATGQKPFKLATWPVVGSRGPQGPEGPQGPPGTAANAEFGVANIFVSRGGARPARFATFSTALGSPAGSTTGGQFRFTCTPAQSPCKVSWGAAVISHRSGRSTVFPRITIHKQSDASIGEPMKFCEYADGANNNLGLARVQRVPTLRATAAAMRERQTLGVGGSLDCGANQPFSPSVNQIWVTSADTVNSNFFDVWVTLTFR